MELMAKVSRGFSPKDRIVDAGAQSRADWGRASHARAEAPSRHGRRSGLVRVRHSVEYSRRATLRRCMVDNLHARAGEQGDVSSLGPACLLGRAVLQQIPSTRRLLRERPARNTGPRTATAPPMIDPFLPLNARPAGHIARLASRQTFSVPRCQAATANPGTPGRLLPVHPDGAGRAGCRSVLRAKAGMARPARARQENCAPVGRAPRRWYRGTGRRRA
jgi:hypothetical protein